MPPSYAVHANLDIPVCQDLLIVHRCVLVTLIRMVEQTVASAQRIVGVYSVSLTSDADNRTRNLGTTDISLANAKSCQPATDEIVIR